MGAASVSRWRTLEREQGEARARPLWEPRQTATCKGRSGATVWTTATVAHVKAKLAKAAYELLVDQI